MIPDICSICNSPRSDSTGPCVVCGAAPEAPARNLPVGTHLQNGKYTLGRVLGEGGFGITYLGAHRYLKRTVAIKELFPERAMRHGTTVSVPDSQKGDFHMEKERVLNEARVISRLDSPHIVGVHDAFLENNTAYIVMEYLEGRSLQERIEAEGPLPPDDVHRIAMATCDALIEVHRHDLLHRDIKPANIMLTRDGRIVLVDFGSARGFDQGRTVRHTRILTVDYAAPEMYSTQARFGPYTDLFCLGGTLFHALTGRQPPSVMDRLQDTDIDLEFPDALRDPLSTTISQALQLRVEDRPQSAEVFKSAFLAPVVPIAEGKVVTVLPSSPPSNPTAVILRNTMDGHTDAVLSIAFHPNGLMLASGGNDQTVRLWDVTTGHLQKTLRGHTGHIRAVAFSSDGRTLASSGDEGTVRLWNTATGSPRHFLYGGNAHSVAFSPDGRILASSGGEDGTIQLWDIDERTLLPNPWGHWKRVFSVAFSPDGRTLASGSADHTIGLWNAQVETFSRRHTLRNHKGSVWCVAFSPNGETLASGGADGVRLWNAVTGTLLQTLKWQGGGVNSLAFSSDGRTLASSGFHLNLWDANTGVLQQTLVASSYQYRINSVAFSPDGGTLVSGGEDRKVRLWSSAADG